ncbi:MAG TPA: chorismate mutase [Spirochaetota bacterium]|nr:chorismate mutase [Spirochaetota bacterium]
MREELKLETIRSNLIRQEETIIFAFIERAQFKTNEVIYKEGGINIPKYQGNFLSYLLGEMERVYAGVRRYTAPDEHPFTKNLPEPYIPTTDYVWPIKKNKININDKIMKIYTDNILYTICENGDCGNYGSSAVCDINILQALSKRIHYGKFVAESKFIENEEIYTKYINEKNSEKILSLLTNEEVEKNVLKRVKIKSETYGQNPLSDKKAYKIKPEVIEKIYYDFVIPLTKEVEVLYLFERV